MTVQTLKAALRNILLLIVAVVLTWRGGRIAVYIGPNDPAMGPTTWAGLPLPYYHCSPGNSLFSCFADISWWSFTLDVVIVFAVLYLAWKCMRQLRP